MIVVQPSRRAFAFILISLCTLSGCGDSKKAKPTGKVSGTVTSAGNPVAAGVVNFESSKTGAAASAEIKAGAFTVSAPMPLGEYTVTVTPPPEAPPVPGESRPPVEAKDIPAKYRNPKTTDLKAEVKEGNNTYEFKLMP